MAEKGRQEEARTSVVQGGGRVDDNARPRPEAYARNTPTWQFSVLPAVPLYCRLTPTRPYPGPGIGTNRPTANTERRTLWPR